MQGSVKIEIDVGKADFSKASQDVQKFARDTGKALDPIKNQKLEMNVADATIKMQKLRTDMKNFQGTLAQKKQLIIDTNNAQSNLTEAKRALQNFKNTGDETTSRLQTKFNQLGQGIRGVFKNIGTMMLATFSVYSIGNFFKGIVEEAMKGQRALAQMGAVIKSTGGSAQLSAKQIIDMSKELSDMTGIEDDVIQTGQNMLLTFANIKGDTFKGATVAILDMATAMNGGASPSAEQLSTTAIRLGKALNDPTVGMTALKKVGVAFTETQKEQIKNFQQAGDLMSAQKVILEELTKEFGGSAQAQMETYGGKVQVLSTKRNNFKETLGNLVIPTLIALIGVVSKVIDFVGRFVALFDGSAKSLSQLNSQFEKGAITIRKYIDKKAELTAKINENRKAQEELTRKYIMGGISMVNYMKQMELLKNEALKLTGVTEGTAVATDALTMEIEKFYKLPFSTKQQRDELEKQRQQTLANIDANIALVQSQLYVEKAKTTQGEGSVAGMPGDLIDNLKIAGVEADKIGAKMEALVKRRKEVSTYNPYGDTPAGEGGGGAGSGTSKMAEQAKADMDSLNAKIKDSESKRKSYQDEVDKTKEKIKELRDSATKDIEDINRQLKDLENAGSSEMASRYAQVVQELSRGGLDSEEENKLLEEKLFLEGKVSEELRNQAVEYAKLSEGQKIYADSQKEIADLVEKQSVATAFLGGKLATTAEGGIGIQDENDPTKIIAITGLKNQQYALDLLNKQQAYDLDLKAQQLKADTELAVYTKLNKDKLALDQQYTKLFGEEVKKQQALVNNLIASMNALASAKGSAGATAGMTTTTNKSTQNNTINVNNNVDVKKVTAVLTAKTR